MTKDQKISSLKADLAKSKAFSDQWRSELKDLDFDKDNYQYLCTEEMISEAELNQAHLEHQIKMLNDLS